MRDLSELSLGIGGIILGVWGIRSVVIQGDLPAVTIVDTLLALVILVIFVVLEILPGNAAQILMGPDASPEAVQALAQKLGLDQPPFQGR